MRYPDRMPTTFFYPGSDKARIGRRIFRPLHPVTSSVAILTGSDDVFRDIAPSVTLGHQMLCSAPKEQDGPVRYSKAFSENLRISFPHGQLAVVALPPLALGCLTPEISYSAASSHESTSFASLLKRTCSGPKGRPSVGRIKSSHETTHMNCVTPQSLNDTSAYIRATLTGLKPTPSKPIVLPPPNLKLTRLV